MYLWVARTEIGMWMRTLFYLDKRFSNRHFILNNYPVYEGGKGPFFDGVSSKLKDKLTYHIPRKVQNFQFLGSFEQALISLSYGVSVTANKNLTDSCWILLKLSWKYHLAVLLKCDSIQFLSKQGQSSQQVKVRMESTQTTWS